MLDPKRNQFVVAVAVIAFSGCSTTSLTARPTTGDKDAVQGFRYYLPTPYVLVKKPILLNSKATDSKTSTTTTTQAAPVAASGPRKPAPAGLVGQSGGAGAGKNDEAPAEPAKKEEKEEKDKEEPKPAPADEGDGLSIVMMPDYCQQQAVSIDVSNAKLDVELQFVDGWRLENVKSTADATLAMTSWIDLAKTTLTSAKDIVAAVFGAKTTEEEGKGGTEGQGGKAASKTTTEIHVKSNETVTETWLHPGVYPLFKRADEKCENAMKLNEEWFKGHTFERSRGKTEDTTTKTVSQ